jgi:hypothetical protein
VLGVEVSRGFTPCTAGIVTVGGVRSFCFNFEEPLLHKYRLQCNHETQFPSIVAYRRT